MEQNKHGLRGEGNKVTQQLLNKGISVIQEQPVHSEEAIENYKIALKNNIFYKVNTFYPYLPISRVFHDELHKLKLKTEIYSINGSCSMPVILPFLAQVERNIVIYIIIYGQKR